MIFSSARLSAQRSGVLGLLAVYLSSILTFNCSTTHSSLIFFSCFLRFQELGAAGGRPSSFQCAQIPPFYTIHTRWMFDGPPKALSELLLRFFFGAQRREKRERAEYLLSLCCCQYFLSSSIPFLSISLWWPPFFASSWDCVCTRLKRVKLDVLFKLPTLHTYGNTVLKLDETHLGKMRTPRMSLMSVWKFNPHPAPMKLPPHVHTNTTVAALARSWEKKSSCFFLRKEHGNFSSEQQISCTR